MKKDVVDLSNKFVFVELRVPENAKRVTTIPTGNYKFIAKSLMKMERNIRKRFLLFIVSVTSQL